MRQVSQYGPDALEWIRSKTDSQQNGFAVKRKSGAEEILRTRNPMQECIASIFRLHRVRG